MPQLSYKINKGFIAEQIGDTVTIYDPEKSVLYTLNETASVIFSLLKKKYSIDRISAELEKKYDVKSQRLQKDLASTLDMLTTNNIITQVSK